MRNQLTVLLEILYLHVYLGSALCIVLTRNSKVSLVQIARRNEICSQRNSYHAVVFRFCSGRASK